MTLQNNLLIIGSKNSLMTYLLASGISEMLQIILEPSLSFIPHILKNILKIFLNDQI